MDAGSVRPAWTPFPGKQTEFLASPEFEVLFGGAKGPGKTTCLISGSTRQVSNPNYRALILRQNWEDLTDIIDRMTRLFGKLPRPPAWNGEHMRFIWPSGAITQVGYCKRIEDVGRWRGKEWTHLAYDELGELAEEQVWDNLLAEIRTPDPTLIPMARASANPGQKGHVWIKRRFIDKCGIDGKRVHRFLFKVEGLGTIELARRYVPARVSDNPIYARDPRYMAVLLSLPEILRRQLLYGDWTAGTGLALDELDEQQHFVPKFDPPSHWTHFGAFDWGYGHPWSFGWYCVDEDGMVFKVDTVRGWRQKPWEIAARIAHRVPVDQLRYIVAGHDCWAKLQARGEDTPSIAEQFQREGILLSKANQDRVNGLNNLRYYTAWRGLGDEGRDGTPALRWMDTPGNRRSFGMLQEITVDPDDVEDALKVDANPETGEGGDDDYDETRYALASRPQRPASTYQLQLVRAFSPEALQYEYERNMRWSEKVHGLDRDDRGPANAMVY